MKSSSSNRKNKINSLLSNVGDMYFKKCVTTILGDMNVRDKDLILDAGCGEGFYEFIIKETFKCSVVGIDHDESIINSARKRLGKDYRIKFEIGDLININYPDNHFDKIICSEVLEHIHEDRKVLKELYRVLKPGGVLFVTVPNKNYPFLWDPLNKIREYITGSHFNPKNRFLGGMWSYDHKRLYSPDDISEIIKKTGFRIEKVELLTRYGIPFYLLVLNIGKIFYTKFPVPEEVVSSMEKFNLGKETEKETLLTRLINLGFGVIKFVDKLNNRELSINEPSMGIYVKCFK